MSLREEFGRDVLLTGWGHSRFGKLADETLESLIVPVATEASRTPGSSRGQVDEIYLGQFNSGMVPLGFASSLALQVSDQLANVPSTRVENACASGSAAFQQGVKSLLAGTASTVLVIGAEKMTHAGADVVGAALLGADYEMAGKASSTGFAGIFAEVARHYEKRHGPVGDTLGPGHIAAKNHRNGVLNPYAQLRKDLGAEFCHTVSDKNPMVADPLRRTDCSPVSDGAAAVVLSTPPTGAAAAPVRLAGFGHANDFLPTERGTRSSSPAAARRGSGRWGWRASGSTTSTSPRCTTASPSPSWCCYEAHRAGRTGPGRACHQEGWVVSRTASCPSTSPAGSRPRATPWAPPASRSTSSRPCSSPAPRATCSCPRPAVLRCRTWAGWASPTTSAFSKRSRRNPRTWCGSPTGLA